MEEELFIIKTIKSFNELIDIVLSSSAFRSNNWDIKDLSIIIGETEENLKLMMAGKLNPNKNIENTLMQLYYDICKNKHIN